MQHDWKPSTLGHGETMCSRCFVTNREAAVLGIADTCDVPNPAPPAANENVREWSQDEIDDDNEYEDDEDGWLDEECSLMDDGQCAMAGTEHCDFTCPNRDSEDFCGSAAWRKKHGVPCR
jgi:hypothetical protein